MMKRQQLDGPKFKLKSSTNFNLKPIRRLAGDRNLINVCHFCNTSYVYTKNSALCLLKCFVNIAGFMDINKSVLVDVKATGNYRCCTEWLEWCIECVHPYAIVVCTLWISEIHADTRVSEQILSASSNIIDDCNNLIFRVAKTVIDIECKPQR